MRKNGVFFLWFNENIKGTVKGRGDMDKYLKIVKQVERRRIRKKPLFIIRFYGLLFYRRKPLESKQHYLRVKQAEMLRTLSRETAWIEKKVSFLWKQSFSLIEHQKQLEEELQRESPVPADPREQAMQQAKKEDAFVQWERGRLEMTKLEEALLSIQEIARLRISQYREYLKQCEHAFCSSVQTQLPQTTVQSLPDPEAYWSVYRERLNKVQEFLKKMEG